MPHPSFCCCSFTYILLLSLLTCSCAFSIQFQGKSREVSLFATPKHVAIAKHSFLRVAAAVLSVPSDVFTSPPMLEPPIKSLLECEYCQIVTQLLAQGWNELETLTFEKTVSDDDDSLAGETVADSDPSTYGEVTDLGGRQLFYYMKMNDGNGDVCFYDLGSGAGKLVAQSFLQIVPRLNHAVGVELDSERHETAISAWDRIKVRAHRERALFLEKQGLVHKEKDSSVAFIQGDLFDVDVSDATHVYIASLCFPNDMMARLAEKLATEALELECVATLKPFPKHFAWRFGTPSVEYVEMSWTKSRGEGCAVYFYTTDPCNNV